jgi:serine protease Do
MQESNKSFSFSLFTFYVVNFGLSFVMQRIVLLFEGISPMARLALTFVMLLSLAGCTPAAKPHQDPLARLDFRKVVSAAKDKVFPAVVYIKCLRESHEQGRKLTEEVSGSGVIISPEGELLTNWHVVDKAVEVRCLLSDGRAMSAKIVGTDKDTDLGLLQLNRPDAKPLPFAEMGDSTRLAEGDFVMAMGAPWGLSRSVSMGIISATRRYLPENSEYSLWLQSDASISPGNSGGPLLSTDGRIVGINTRAIMYGGDMGFAVPSETIAIILPRLREFGKVNWSWTGLQLQPLRDFDRNMFFDDTTGVIVAETDPESPARRAGILVRDRIVAIDGAAVTARTAEDLPLIRRHLGLLPMLKPIKVTIERDGKTSDIQLTPTEKGKVEGSELDCPRWDLTAKTINRFDNPDLYFARKEGVFVYGVKEPGNASNAGLVANDVIVKVDDKEITTLEQIKSIHLKSLDSIAEKPRLVVTVLRNGLMRQIVLDISRDYQKQ